jgi:hypothetical protein
VGVVSRALLRALALLWPRALPFAALARLTRSPLPGSLRSSLERDGDLAVRAIGQTEQRRTWVRVRALPLRGPRRRRLVR